MKSLLWRLRSNAVWFLLALGVFTGIYLMLAYSELRYSYLSFGFEHADPFLASMFISFGFFMFYTKRYTYDEEYLYGHSRKYTFFASQCAAVIYALLFASYALGVALLVRRSYVSGDVIVSANFYKISVVEIFYNFLSLFIVDMLMFETADILRKFRTWKFWVAVAVCAAAVVGVSCLYINIASKQWFNYWIGMFVIFTPLFFVAKSSNLFMTRGRQYR